MSCFKEYHPGSVVGNGESFVRFGRDDVPLFTVNPAASADQVLEFANLTLDAVASRLLGGGVAEEIDGAEAWALGRLVQIAQGCISAVVGEP